MAVLGKRIVINLLIGLIVGGLVVLGNTQSFFEVIELGLYNTRFETFRGHRTAANDIVILGVDIPSLQEMGPFPWTRDVHATLAEKLIKLGAKAVAFDVMFLSESQFPEADRQLKNTLAKHKDKVMVVSTFAYGSGSSISGSGASGTEAEVEEASTLSPPIFEDVTNFGFAEPI